MNTHGYIVVVCFAVVLSTRLTTAIGGTELEQLMSKLEDLKEKLQTVENSVESSVKVVDINQQDKSSEESVKFIEENYESLQKTEQSLQKALATLEEGMKERIDNVDAKFAIRMNAVEDSLQKTTKGVAQSVKTSEQKTARDLHELENKLTSKLNSVEQNLIALNISYHETSQTELRKEEENKETLDILKFAVQNVTTVVENSKKILATHFTYPARTCRDVTKLSGRYVLHRGENLRPFKVFCEQSVYGGGWTVIQYRFEGYVQFYRDWSEYRDGFGNVDGEFWLGLEHVHRMTKDRPHELIVEVKDFEGNYGYAKYDAFEIGDESEMYKLKTIGRYSGTAGDAMLYNRGENFSTFDRDNDKSEGNCAEVHHGAWWYYNCGSANLNGYYDKRAVDETSITWFRQKKPTLVSYTRMMIREIIY